MSRDVTAVTQKGNEFYSKVRYFGWAASAAMFAGGVFLAASPGGGGEPLINRSMVGGLVSVAVAWLSWVLTYRPRVFLLSESITVRNWFTETVIPYGRIARVRTSGGLTLELKDGYEVRVCVVGKSPLGEMSGYPSAKKIKRSILPFLAEAELVPSGAVREKVSLSLKVPAIVAGLHGACYFALKYLFHVA
ncbi:PH domain-containing protein [Streptomyces sp. NPDC017520]|uniref:PH domain-containing protein n=1 Tax=Streptomyces sp. NPDC017520 TaxID=3364998 RepID=UPI0037A75C0A